MKKIYIPVLALGLIVMTSGCKKFLELEFDNNLSEDQILADPAKAEGILLNAYNGLPSSLNITDVATDNAVINVKGNNLTEMATGEWKATNYPLSAWSSAYKNITYVNLFLKYVDKVEWSWESTWQNTEFAKKLKGEAYGLRAFYEYQLLEAHAGITGDGTYLGFPIIADYITANDNWQNIKRGTYADCFKQIKSDLDSAIKYLPAVYADKPAGDPVKSDYDKVYGARFKNRMNGEAAMFLKAKLLLHAASPAFSATNVATYADAANAAAALLKLPSVGGLAKLTATRIEYYLLISNTDILWRRDQSTNSSSLEANNFPPSLYGKGQVNPSQNFVDAFPTIKGYPIRHGSSGFVPATPFLNRDPRLAKYVIYNTASFKNVVINTVSDPKDGFNAIETSTRTGYYLKKHLLSTVNRTPGGIAGQTHYYALMRYTEAFLMYAEAANQAWEPDVDGGSNGFTARDVIAKIRSTAGITPDSYLPLVTTKYDMDALIRNERRIELSFEGSRFWDIRRWNDLNKIKELVKGTSDGGLSSLDVEPRVYSDYMIYGPVPDSEVKKGLIQNIGW
ncbi:MAG TPA: RagB/SusD family nutrient uptake outer membrane protein [Bacteroidales bacterium]|nr:RagB/SusD family nutrient uptake outer membrane protein [Bacteroidales bacterium]